MVRFSTCNKASNNEIEKNMDKAQMIDAIIGAAKSAAILANKFFDAGDMFFSLAFRTDDELKSLCKKLNIKA